MEKVTPTTAKKYHYFSVKPIGSSTRSAGNITVIDDSYKLTIPKQGTVNKAQLVINDPNCLINIKIVGQKINSFQQNSCTACNDLPQQKVTYPTDNNSVHTAALIVAGMQLARNEVNALLAKSVNLPTLIDNNGTIKNDLSDAIKNYLSFTTQQDGDDILLQKATENYYNGLKNVYVYWGLKQLKDLDNNFITDKTQNNFDKITTVDTKIKDYTDAGLSVINSGIEAALFIASAALFPDVGAKPRSPYSTGTQQAIVDAAQGGGGGKLLVQFESGEAKVFFEDGVTQVGSGYLESGYIKMEINVKVGEEGAKLAKGSDVFKQLFSIITKNNPTEEIKGISGTWFSGLGDNLNTFNNLITTKVKSGLMSESEAALNTFTGKMASRNGFSKVESISGLKNVDGTYKYVTSVKFVK